MSDLRFDPVFGVWAAIAEVRRSRPVEFLPLEQNLKQLICPFCCGNEDETPPPLLLLDEQGGKISDAGSRSWSSRVIPNKYPTFLADQACPLTQCGPYQQVSLPGIQELVIPTPRHVLSLPELTIQEYLTGLRAAQYRMTALSRSENMAHAMLFGNCRYEAGASIAHVHFQLIGSPLVTPALNGRRNRFQQSLQTGIHLLERVVQFELQQAARIVRETDDFLLLCPFASRMAFQVWVVPRNRRTRFQEASQNELRQVAELCQWYVDRIERLLSKPAYNWMLHQLPFVDSDLDAWFVEIVPRVSRTAGYEWGTDIWVNPIAPETAARRLQANG